MNGKFSFARFMVLSGVAMAFNAGYMCLFETIVARLGLAWAITMFFCLEGVLCLFCIDLSQKLNLRLVVITGLIGWVLTIGMSIWYLN